MQFKIALTCIALIALIALLTACGSLPIIVAFTASPKQINVAGTVKLSWDVQNATSISIDNGVGDVTGSSSKDVTVNATTVFTMTASNASGPTKSQLTVTIGASAENKVQPPDTISKVDTLLVPISRAVPGVSFSSVKSAAGAQADFISNELIVSAASRQIVDAFAQRIGGSVEQATGTVLATGLYRVKVANPKGNVADLAAQLKRNTPFVRDDLSFSSDQAHNLVALAATENGLAGLTVGLNWVMQPTAEQALTTPPDTTYSSNARDWPYMKNGGDLDIGVVGAWNRLAAVRNRIKVAVFDGGFRKSADLPSDTVINPSDGYNRANPSDCSGNPCPWHGLRTSTVLAGIEDNNLGIAGSAGRYASLLLVPSGNSVETWFEWIGATVGTIESGSRIINVSAGTDIPASLAWAAEGGWGLMRAGIRLVTGSKFPLIIAAAGNSGLDVDRKSCFSPLGLDVACWESVVAAPCEMDEVLCVGGTDNWGSRNVRAPKSNYGSQDEDASVELFAPYTFWTIAADPATPDSNAVKIGNGTSFGAPFVSGVAAMVFAANPNLTAAQVRDALLRTAHPAGGEIRRFIHADAAVKDALGPQKPPVVTSVLANQATRNRSYLVELIPSGINPLFGSSAVIKALDPNSTTGEISGLTLNVTPPLGFDVQRLDARRFNITPSAEGKFKVKYAITNSDQTTINQSFDLLVQAPTAALIIHPGSGTAYVGGNYYAVAKAYEQLAANGPRRLLPCSQVKWEITSIGGTSTVNSGNGGLDNCVLETRFPLAQQVTIQAKVVDTDGSTIKQSATTVVTVFDTPQGSNLDFFVLTNGFGNLLNPQPSSLNYYCGSFSNTTLGGVASGFVNADRVKHQIVNVTSGTQLTPAAAPRRTPYVLYEAVDTDLTVSEINVLNLLAGTEAWYGRHVFSLFTVERDGMTFVRPSIIDVINICVPN
jgi:Subtilase family